jgi:hypothetical protein
MTSIFASATSVRLLTVLIAVPGYFTPRAPHGRTGFVTTKAATVFLHGFNNVLSKLLVKVQIKGRHCCFF